MLKYSKRTLMAHCFTTKMVLLVRTDLKMRPGKVAAQCCHACLGAYRQARNQDILKRWLNEGEKIVTLKIGSEQELLTLYQRAKMDDVNAFYIEDLGLTQVAEGSKTVLAIGPDTDAKIDRLVGELKLY